MELNEEKILTAFTERLNRIENKQKLWERIFSVLQEAEIEMNLKTMTKLGLEIVKTKDQNKNVVPESALIILGNRARRDKTENNNISDVLKYTLDAVKELGGKARADEVSKITKRHDNIEGSYLNKLWKKRFLLTRKREGRFVFYSTPERALIDLLKQTDKLTIDHLIKKLSEYAYDHTLEANTMISVIESAEKNNIVKIENGMVPLLLR